MNADPIQLEETAGHDEHRRRLLSFLRGYERGRASMRLRVVAIAILAALIGFSAGRVSATPRPAAVVIPTAEPSAGESDLQRQTEASQNMSGVGARRSEAASTGMPPLEPRLRTAAPRPSSPAVSPEAHDIVSTPAPTTLGGVATWHATGRDGMYAAAGPAIRVGSWRGRLVEVCATYCVSVRLNDFCLCGNRHGEPTLLDLSDESFAKLAPLSRGVIAVTVSW